MPKRYPKKAREVAEALYLEGLSVPEITRRLNEGTAGLIDKEGKPQPLDIGERRVAEYVAEYKAQHGPRPEPEDEELTVDSINRVKQRALNVLAREIAHLEGLPKGRISAKQSTALRQHYATLDDMERRQEIAEKRKGKGKRGKGKAPSGRDKPVSALEALAKGEGDQVGVLGGADRAQSQSQSQEHDGDHEDGHLVGHQREPSSDQTESQSQESTVIPRDIGTVARHVGKRLPGLSKEELEEIMGSARA